MDAAALAGYPCGTQVKIIGCGAKPELIHQSCVVLGIDGNNLGQLMLVTSTGSVESLFPEDLDRVHIEPFSQVVIVDAYRELPPELVLQCGVATAFHAGPVEGLWTVSLDNASTPGLTVQVAPRNIVLLQRPLSDNTQEKFPSGTQVRIIGSGAKAELMNQSCVVLGMDGTNPGQLMLVTSTGSFESLLPELLDTVHIEPLSRVVIVDAYRELPPELVLQGGVATAFHAGLWSVSLDNASTPGLTVQIAPRNLVLLQRTLSVDMSEIPSEKRTLSDDMEIPSEKRTLSDEIEIPSGKRTLSDDMPEIPSETSAPELPKASTQAAFWNRMQDIQDDLFSEKTQSEDSEKENAVHPAQNVEVGSPRLELTPDGQATILRVVCMSRKGLMKDLSTALANVGVDIEQCDIAAPQGRTVAELRIVEAEAGGPIDQNRREEVCEAAKVVAECTPKSRPSSRPSRSLRGRRFLVRSNSIEYCDVHPPSPRSRQNSRSQKRILIIGPGFGLELNKEQIAMVFQAGYQVKCVFPPSPEIPGFNMIAALGEVRAAIDEFQPHMVGAASKGGAYLLALWQTRHWTGPSLLINAHPSCTSLPQNVPIVMAHGSNDKIWPKSRADVERLISTGTRNMCFLYYTANSGMVGGGYTRQGDEHNMASLLTYDCLPRLIDAAMSAVPELSLMRTWLGQLRADRLSAEHWLGYSAEQFRGHWDSLETGKLLADVARGGEEFDKVAALFHAMPVDPASNVYPDVVPWESTGIVRIERVQNEMQLEGSFVPYYEQLKAAVESQDIQFEKGVHTRWAFHGTDAIDAIISNPITGFQPLAAGTRAGSIWGPGTYFARDAKYVARAGFATPQPDGTRRMLLCLLATGLPCLGDPDNRGVLPVRCGQHRYHSSVDSMNNPEVHIIQNPAAAYPAYIITFV